MESSGGKKKGGEERRVDRKNMQLEEDRGGSKSEIKNAVEENK